jgi:hypothetical protein
MTIKKIIQEEVNDFGWMDDVSSLPPLEDIPKLERGTYKLWIGEVSVEEQMSYIETLIQYMEDSGKVFIGMNTWIDSIKSGRIEIDSLYIDVDGDNKFRFNFMGWNRINSNGKTYENRIEYNRNYYDNRTGLTPLN